MLRRRVYCRHTYVQASITSSHLISSPSKFCFHLGKQSIDVKIYMAVRLEHVERFALYRVFVNLSPPASALLVRVFWLSV
ncbi:hypothetical protein QVD17_18739 [Tagetes erecta]|uniref:Uncharacterized protein n=1 Tax=Tagetes erecta TaxID=13708 RepID=A0AAD8NWM1_TARER|nr:hypothetical protein QVD17_18739 [Tagetes erecta]